MPSRDVPWLRDEESHSGEASCRYRTLRVLQGLPAPVSEPIEVDGATFDEIIAAAKVPVLVDFWASWCGPCRMAAPEVQKLAQAMGGRALVLKVDTEAHPALSARFGIQSIPKFVVFRGGKPVFQRAGLAPQAEMQRWLA